MRGISGESQHFAHYSTDWRGGGCLTGSSIVKSLTLALE